jgi:hypothetical protein
MFRPRLSFAAPLNVVLHGGELLSWKHATPTWLKVVAGRAWVTQSSELDDHFLGAGASLALKPGAAVLISAEHEAELRFEA